MEPVIVGGEKLYVHERWQCEGRQCSIHAPSEHSMRLFPLHWRDDRGLMERTCPHGVGHPDPDHIAFIQHSRGAEAAQAESIHGCCPYFCCGDDPDDA